MFFFFFGSGKLGFRKMCHAGDNRDEVATSRDQRTARRHRGRASVESGARGKNIIDEDVTLSRINGGTGAKAKAFFRFFCRVSLS